MTIAYDGTNFAGWQIQPGERTVQGEVMSALERMHRCEVRVLAAGRTDSGVHADGQVISFLTSIHSLPAHRFPVALNSYLPRDVQALAGQLAPDDFHARYWARLRHYRYYWTSADVVPPAIAHRVAAIKHRPSIRRLNELARPLIGAHDFSTFTLPSEPSESRVREVTGIAFFPQGDLVVMHISANAFLWRMVRSIAGTLIELDKTGAEPVQVRERLRARDHGAAGPSAPAKGLVLHRVEYGDGDWRDRG